MRNSKLLATLLAIGAISLAPVVFAEAPVEDYSTDEMQNNQSTNDQPADQTNVDDDQPIHAKGPMKSEAKTFPAPATDNSFTTTQTSTYTSSKTTPAATKVDTSNLSLPQRITRLENQVNNLNQTGSQKRLEDIEQQLQKLSGDLEVQQHNLEQLQNEMHDLYNNLDQRLNKNGKTSNSEAVSTLPKQSPATDDTLSKSSMDDSLQSDIAPSAKNTPKAKAKKNTAPTADANNDEDVMTPVTTTSTVTTSSNTTSSTDQPNSPADQKAYQSAFELLQTKQYTEGTKKLKAYLATYPNGAYAGNAHYWLGEIYYLNQKSSQAKTEFATVIHSYSSSPKVPEALLKLAMIHDSEGKHVQAQNEFRQIKKRYPKSAAAKLADEQLKASITTN